MLRRAVTYLLVGIFTISLGSAIASQHPMSAKRHAPAANDVPRTVSMDSDVTNVAKPQMSSSSKDVRVRTAIAVGILEVLTNPLLASKHR